MDEKERGTLGLCPSAKTIAAVTGALLLLLLGLLVWQAGHKAPDPNAVPLTEEERLSPEELQSRLQAQADGNGFRVRINSRPRVVGREAELLLENPVENKRNLSVTITLNQGEKTVYESGSLIPGAQELTAELEQELPPGEYPATARCVSIDPKTGEAAGSQALVDMVLDVEKSPEAPKAQRTEKAAVKDRSAEYK